MLREIVKPDSDVLTIHIPKEYVDEELEVLVFKNSEVIKKEKVNSKDLIKEFDNISRNISVFEDKNIDILKIDEEMYSDIF